MTRLLPLLVASCGLLVLLGETSSRCVADEPPNIVQMEVFVRGDLASAETVANYVRDLEARVQGLEVITRDVIKDRQHLARLYELTQKAGRDKPVVPAFYCCDRMYFGFENAATSGPAIEELFTADVYTRATCQHCIDAKRFLKVLEKRWPAIRFRIYEITNDVAARQRWEALCRGGGSAPGLPVIDFGRHVIIGYQGDEVTGKQIEDLIRKKSRITPSPGINDQSSRLPIRGTGPLLLMPQLWMTGMLQEDIAGDEPANESVMDMGEFALPDEATDADTGEASFDDEPIASAESVESIEVPVFGELRVRDLGMPLFSFLVGLVDGFNPCAMWVLVFLLSVLVNVKDRRKIILIAGTFVFVSGAAYYAFMAAWLSLFLFIGIARPVQIALGVLALFIGVVNVKDFFAFKKGISFSIPESQKPGLYRRVRKIVEAKYLTAAIAGAVALAVVVNMVELLCTAGLPALFTQVLTLQELPLWQNHLYLLIYILAYMLDDMVLVSIVVVTLSHRKLQEREGQWLKLLSGLVILALGLCMLFRPEWLQLGS
ncbi:glutaredoxin family protein [Aporhodopirellula aestuarii]|uniref:Uncharacterized protein n=1 Tax=Aporhodopirellula aestuarii TaxID=2950107 RepID=A0ABT0UC18_9BACT|nr:hypothetical protein [Aporhodopirellula aestuarii]MCM2374414.1 hypothetical protein [Aporhodopirellula aestuarii]